jgi:glutamyl-tRNA reductase
MSFVVVGTNYKYSPIELREKIYFSKKRIREALNFLIEISSLNAAVILSTCNRVEIYASVSDEEKGVEELKDFISQYHEIDRQDIYPYLYGYSNNDALKHLLLVCCGIDSLIVGERQILEQVKSCFLESENNGFTDYFLKKIFYYALDFSQRICAQTNISKGEISASSVAVDFIKDRVGSLKDKNILIVGTGKVTELVLQHLSKEDSKVIFISSRNFKKAQEFAKKIIARAVRFEDLENHLKEADIVITATASPYFIIKKETLEGAAKQRLIIIDLAVPRDVSPDVRQLENVELFNLEDLGYVIENNLNKKKNEIEKAKQIVDIEVESLWTKVIESAPELALLP